MAKTSSVVELQPIDRLEEKVKLLVSNLDRLRGEHTRAKDENARLNRDLDAARTRIAELEGASAEMTTLREEREMIRTRVAEMLAQIETLEL
jgi:hypothetical protein